MPKTLMTSIKIQKPLHFKMQQQVINEGYGMRGKSKWINEAVENFLKLTDYPTLTHNFTDTEEQNISLSIRLPEELMQKLNQAIIQVRRSYPAMEGVKSCLIRASILQRVNNTPK
jgi:metal-responsive CopG/Arc/MetJ family transcriptional regulator